jgi:predicted ATPase
MKCPRCREENTEDSKICKNCGLKLKISCPKCKNLNSIGQERCSSCNLKLITFCPECKAPNYPIAKVCRKCQKQLLLECPNCKSLNPVNTINCRKCSYNLKEKTLPKQVDQDITQLASEETVQQVKSVQKNKLESPPKMPLPELQEYAVISIELINLSAIKAKIQRPDIVSKLQNFFIHVTELNAKKFKELSITLNEQTVAISFLHQNNLKNSALYSLLAAREILKEINELNYKIQNTLKIKLKIKMGISIVNIENNEYYSQIERSAATAENVVVSKEVYNLTSDKFNFEIMSSVPVEDKLTTVYKLQDPLGIHFNPDIIVEEPCVKVPEEEVPIVQPAKVKTGKKREANQNNIIGLLLKTLPDSQEGMIIGIAAPDGYGKTTVVSTTRQFLANKNIKFLIGQCQPINEIIPFAYFQDLLRNLFNIPPFITNIEESKRNISNILFTELNIKDKNIEEAMLDLLICENLSNTSNILKNKNTMFESIKTIFNSLKAQNNLALIIEDFDYIDSISLECIKYLIKNGLLNEKTQIIATHKPEINLSSYFEQQHKDDRIFDVHLLPMSKEEANKFIFDLLKGQDLIPSKLKDKIYINSKGMPVYIEQALWLLYDAGAIYNENNILKFNLEAANINLPDNVDEILKIRLTQLNKISSNTTKIILNACIFGQKFVPSLLQAAVEIEENQFVDLLHTLESSGFFSQNDQYSLIFKNRIIYNLIYQQGYTEEEKISHHSTILKILNNYTKTSNAMLAIHAELATLYNDAINYWNLAAKEASSVGDSISYINAQQRLLSLLEMMNVPDKENITLEIYEEIGKTNYEINPEAAQQYLTKAIIEREKRTETIKLIELTGYLAKSSELSGNFAGVIECVDKALSQVNQEELPVEYALLNYCKLEAVYNSGKAEEAVYLAKNDILPVLRTAISKNKTISGLSIDELKYTEIETELLLAKAYTIQGNKEALNICASLINKSNDLGLKDIEIQSKLIEALYKTLQGEINSSRAILEYFRELILQLPDNSNIKMLWYFINLLTYIFDGKFDEAEKLIDPAIIIAKESKDYNIFALIKLFEGIIHKESQNFEKAKAIYNDIIMYCSERKLAISALAGWYLYSELEMKETNIDKAYEVAERALEISQKAGINNYFMSILLQRQLGEIQIIKGDFEAARMHTEQALLSARDLGLYLLEAKLFLTYGKIFQEIAAISSDDKQNNVNLAHEYFMEALNIAQKLENEYIILKIEKEFVNLSTFCQLSGITI